MRRVLNEAATFTKVSLNNLLFSGPELLQNFMHTKLRFPVQLFAVIPGIEGMEGFFRPVFWNKINHPSALFGGMQNRDIMATLQFTIMCDTY